MLADSLVKAMFKRSLYLRSPKGVITYKPKSGMSFGTTINLVWVNQQSNDLLVACLVEKDNTYNHHTDHHTIKLTSM